MDDRLGLDGLSSQHVGFSPVWVRLGTEQVLSVPGRIVTFSTKIGILGPWKRDFVDSIAIFGISSIPIFRIEKDMVFGPFVKRYFLNVTEFSGLMITW